VNKPSFFSLELQPSLITLQLFPSPDAKYTDNLYILQRPPVVGILTRHDFMPEHVLGLYPHIKSHKQNISVKNILSSVLNCCIH